MTPMQCAACVGISLITLAFVGCSTNSSAPVSGPEISTTSAPEDRPNILLIVVDDMGYTDIGSFGSEIATGSPAFTPSSRSPSAARAIWSPSSA